MNDVSCFMCGAQGGKISTHKNQATLPMGGGVPYVGTFHTCSECGFHWEDSDDAIEEALGRARQALATKLLAGQRQAGIIDPYFERVLSLPFGSLKLWETACPPEGLALLRLVKMRPELLELMEPGRLRGKLQFGAILDDAQW